jgi:hypothetical protein
MADSCEHSFKLSSLKEFVGSSHLATYLQCALLGLASWIFVSCWFSGSMVNQVAEVFSGLFAAFFSVGCIPIHPFVDPSALWRPFEPMAARHGIFCCDHLADTGSSQSKKRLVREAPSH